MNFRISALDRDRFTPLFDLSDAALAERLAVRCVATSSPGYPCRVSLEDAAVGETLLLVNYTHLALATPYRASHAIYVRANAMQARPSIGEVPALLRARMLSLRAFDRDGMIVTADLCAGTTIEELLARQFALRDVAYVHIHYAKYGCYAARADRVD